ncbi:hypothetical protein FXO38_14163 [Capsicum annuum]|nr:hypothetical protein FXO38_14163 [Capsicum annuum]
MNYEIQTNRSLHIGLTTRFATTIQIDPPYSQVATLKARCQFEVTVADTSGLVATLIADRDVETMLCLNLEEVYHLQTKQILPLANVTAQLAGKKFNIEAKKPYAKSTDTGTPKLIIVSFVENEPSLNTESIGKRKMYETDMTTSSNYMSGRSHHKNNTEVKILDVKSYHKIVLDSYGRQEVKNNQV